MEEVGGWYRGWVFKWVVVSSGSIAKGVNRSIQLDFVGGEIKLSTFKLSKMSS